MSAFRKGTVIANTKDEDFNPYVLTNDGWIEVGRDGTYPLAEDLVLAWLDDDGWEVIFRGRKRVDAGGES